MPQRSIPKRLIIGLTCALYASAPSPAAAQSRDVLAEYTVTSWSARNGLPSNGVWAIAQDAVGYLWLATDAGLVRFDGIRFVSGESLGLDGLPSVQAFSFAIGNDGALWVGFARSGGIARIMHRQVQTFDSSDGLGGGTVNAIVVDSTGSVLAGTDEGLYQLDGLRWRHVGFRVEERVQILGLTLDPGGDILVATSSGVWRRDSHHRWMQVIDSGFTARAVPDPAGGIWFTDLRTGFRRLDTSGHLQEHPDPGSGHRLLLDRQDNLWVGTLGQGLWRARRTADGQIAVDRLPSADPVYSILEDRQGSIWVGTVFGLTQLTPRQLRPVHESPLMRSVTVATGGRLWAATPMELIQIDTTQVPAQLVRRVPVEGVRVLHADATGQLWASTGQHLLRLDGTTLRPISSNTVSTKPLSNIDAIASDSSGHIWVHDAGEGLHRVDPVTGLLIRVAPRLDSRGPPHLLGDRKGRLWVSSGGQVGVVEDDGIRWLLTFHATTGGALTLHEDSLGNVWAVGDEIIARFSGVEPSTLRAPRVPWRRAMSAVIDGSDQLWVGSEIGLQRVSLSDFDEVVADPDRSLRQTGFEPTDRTLGLTARTARPNAVRAENGSLWFITDAGLSSLEPASARKSAQPPPPQIETVLIDGQVRSADAGMRVPPGPARIVLDYALADLQSPLKTRFRYQLEPIDHAWIVAGTGRQATYTNLPAGAYTFRVQATDDTGAWTEPGSMLEFNIESFFYETSWFAGLTIAAVALLGYGGWHLRVRAIEQRAESVMNERMRLSREIHDTLMQGLAGVALQFDAISRQVNPDVRPRLDRLREFVEESLADARRTIQHLRSPDGRSILTGALRDAVERSAKLADLEFEFVVSGLPGAIDPQVEHHIFRIVQEAVANVVRHASASGFRVELRFSGERVELEVSDDGRGIDLDAHELPDDSRFGLIGMRERAEQLGGTLTVQRNHSGGTIVAASLPTVARGGRRH